MSEGRQDLAGRDGTFKEKRCGTGRDGTRSCGTRDGMGRFFSRPAEL